MKKRGLVIGLLVMLAVITSGFTYAFWAGQVQTPINGTVNGVINVGEGNNVTTTVALTGDAFTGGELVPAGFDNDGGEVDEVILTFTVAWNVLSSAGASLDDSASLADLTITPTVVVKDELDADVTATVGTYVLVTPNVANADEITLGAAAITISFTVTLTEPDTIAHYNALKNGTIEIEFEFAISNVSTNNA